MKIVSYTMINNEANVIESFVRYNIAFIDEMIFIDNGCTDNSIPILRALISEGLNIKIFDESLQPLNLSYIENKYIKIAIEAEKADLVIPLDADEYISANINEDNLYVKIQNKGKTIAKEDLGKIFGKFNRLDGSRQSDTAGAGLGLSIAKEIINLHGGNITAESSNNEIIFHVEIPLE